MSISKEQWLAIAAELKGSWVQVKFKLHGHEIYITRERKSESTTVLAVYIDGAIKGDWMKELAEIDPADEFMNKVVKQVHCHKFKARWNKKELDRIARFKRSFGVKEARKETGSMARWPSRWIGKRSWCCSAGLLPCHGARESTTPTIWPAMPCEAPNSCWQSWRPTACSGMARGPYAR